MTEFSNTIAIILAGGKGKRMKSDLPKVMHLLAGRPVIRHVTDTLEPLGFAEIVLVVGHGRELLFDEYRGSAVKFAVQEQQLGTADAVKAAWKYFADFSGDVLVTLGDVPLLSEETLRGLVGQHSKSPATVTVLTAFLEDPTGYGRVVRGEDGFIKKIVEHADATDEERQIREINTGIIMFEAEALRHSLGRIDRNNEQGEFYLTDAVKILLQEGKLSGAVALADPREGLGINSTEQLAQMEGHFREIKNVDNRLGEL